MSDSVVGLSTLGIVVPLGSPGLPAALEIFAYPTRSLELAACATEGRSLLCHAAAGKTRNGAAPGSHLRVMKAFDGDDASHQSLRRWAVLKWSKTTREALGELGGVIDSGKVKMVKDSPALGHGHGQSRADRARTVELLRGWRELPVSDIGFQTKVKRYAVSCSCTNNWTSV